MKIILEPNLKPKTTDLRNLKEIQNSDNQNKSEKKKIISKKYIIFIGIGILISFGLIIMAILLSINFNKKHENIQNSEFNLGTLESEPGYEFATKMHDLRRFNIIENNTEDNNINGTNSKNIIIRNTTYDFIIISEEEATEEYKNLYNKTYLAVVAISRECFCSENKSCEQNKFVDLIDQDFSNLKNSVEVEDLKDIPIYLCIFNYTDNNIILSMSCPESLSEFKKNIILSDLHFFKPTSIKRVNKKKRNITITQKSDGNKYLIREKNYGSCKFGNQLNSLCARDMNITKDLKGNIISLDEENMAKIVKNKNNTFIKNKSIKLKDITKECNNLSSDKYLNILNKLIPELKKYMKVKEYLSLEDFKEIYKENKGEFKNYLTKRNLEEVPHQNYIKIGKLFNYTSSLGINYEINLINGNSFYDTLEAINEIKINGNSRVVSKFIEYNDNFYVIKEIMNLKKASEFFANNLYYEMKENLDRIDDILWHNLTSLNNLTINIDLENIMNLTILPFNIIKESNILKNLLQSILDGIKKVNLKNKIDLLNNNIKDYINNTQLAKYKIYNNLKELYQLLNSPKSKLTEIIAYYLNNTSSPYNIIEEAKQIFDSYYKNEYNLIISKIDFMLNNFKTVTFNKLQNYTKLIDNLKEYIRKNNNSIENANDIDYINIISNLENSNNLIKEIIEIINNNLKNGILFEDSGYFITNKNIDNNKDLFNKIINALYSIAQKLKNNEFIDKSFNEVMIKYKNNINSDINYIYQIID